MHPHIATLARCATLLTLVGGLAASASAPKQHSVNKAMSSRATFDQTWSAVIEVFADRSWTIENMEKDSGLITTDWMNLGGDSPFADCGGSGISSVVNREIRFNVLVRDLDGTTGVTVNATFREARSWDNRQWYVDCTSNGQVERLIHSLVAEALSRQPVRRPPPGGDTPQMAPPPPVPSAPESTPPPAPSADGTLGGACYGNQTCNAGLQCDDILNQCTPAE